MKILVGVSEYPPEISGVGNMTFEIIKRFQNEDIDVDVCSVKYGDIVFLKGKRAIMTSKYYNFNLLLTKILFWRFFSKYAYKYKDSYDIIWVHNPYPIGCSLPIEKTLVTIHTTSYGRSLSPFPSYKHVYQKILSKFEKKYYKNFKKIVAVAPQVYYELRELGVPKHKLYIILNGVDTNRFRPRKDKIQLRKTFGIPEDVKVFLSVGRLAEQKQPTKLIELFKILTKYIKDIFLVIAGTGPLMNKLNTLISSYKLKNKILLKGYVEDSQIHNLYACADYYIISSKYEGLPLTLLEAMSSGLPCIISDIPNLRRIITQANCGITLNFNDINNACIKLVDYINSNLYRKHSRNARVFAVKNLDWSVVAEKYLNIMREISYV